MSGIDSFTPRRNVHTVAERLASMRIHKVDIETKPRVGSDGAFYGLFNASIRLYCIESNIYPFF